MKRPSAVVAAKAVASSKAAELAAAKEAVRRLEGEYGQAQAAVRSAQVEADAQLPQCDMVAVRRYTGTDGDVSRVVIVRKTASGMLVVRRVGDATAHEFKFKWWDFGGKFSQAEKVLPYSVRRELRNVPVEYIPVLASHPEEE